jgi:hypothetical protein
MASQGILPLEGDGPKHTACSPDPSSEKWAGSISIWPSAWSHRQALFPRGCGRQEGEQSDWRLFGLSDECNSHLLAFSQETVASLHLPFEDFCV